MDPATQDPAWSEPHILARYQCDACSYRVDLVVRAHPIEGIRHTSNCPGLVWIVARVIS